MERHEMTRKRLAEHYCAYPQMEITDLFKYLFQSAWGCEHMVPSVDAAMDAVRREYTCCTPVKSLSVDPLDGAYSRVHHSCPEDGVSPETLGKLFCRSSRVRGEGNTALTQKLSIARDMIQAGELPFSLDEFDQKQAEWCAHGYPAVRHSEAFREIYRPAYRVIANTYVRLLPFLAGIDHALQKRAGETVIVAIEGGSASGKTTLAKLLSELYDCTVFHMDDFFLRPEQRTPARRAEIGGNVDRERFLEEVLRPLSEGKSVCFRRFDCGSQALQPPVTVTPTPLTVIEGAYSMHPELATYYDLSLFLEISPACQRERILKRNPSPWAERFFEEWIPLEQAYFERMDVKARCNLSLDGEGL
jgi:thymidylate kinase